MVEDEDCCENFFVSFDTRPLQIVGTNFDFRGPAHQICPPPLVGNIVRRNYIQNIWREEVITRMTRNITEIGQFEPESAN